ncbi:uncharacterized protein [Cherax quadricarinatus]|uniref:uncharacterized protein n=1 Tax=Cherax quadricarinatus TaxID=27406 RepID=UPI00387E32D5
MLKPNNYSMPNKLTKRVLLAEVSKCFDPLGLVSPLTIRGKLLIQEAWKFKCAWDEILPEEFINRWDELIGDYEKIPMLEFPRQVANPNGKNVLHIFCDASKLAYGAVAYLQCNSVISLVMSKAKVSPIKSRTLPQLELTAIYVGVKLANYIRNKLQEINISDTVIWSDNEVSLQWIRNGNSKIVYVQNRVTEINQIQEKYNSLGQHMLTFNHIPGEENPTDFLSRGLPYAKFVNAVSWFKGPSWLVNKANWPVQKAYIAPVEITVTTTPIVCPSLAIDINRYSSLPKLINVTKLVFKFLNKMNISFKFSQPLEYWIKRVQEMRLN